MRFDKKSILCLLLASQLHRFAHSRALPADHRSESANSSLAAHTTVEPGVWASNFNYDLLVRAPKDKDGSNSNSPGGTTSPDPNSNPGDDDIGGIDPGAGLDPTRPDSGDIPQPSINPGAGLDPTRPEISASPSSVAAAPSSTPSDASQQPGDQPICKRAGGGDCPNDDAEPTPEELEAAGPSGDGNPDAGGIGDEPDISTPEGQRTQQQLDNEEESELDYISDQVEQPNAVPNRFTARLLDRIRNEVPDPEIRDADFANYNLKSKTGFDIFKNDPENGPDHDQYIDMFRELGIDVERNNGGMGALLNKRYDAFGEATQRWSYSADGKAIFADWSFNTYDIKVKDGRQPFPNKAAYILRKQGVDLLDVQAVGRSSIINTATIKTIATAYERLPHVGPGGRYVRVRGASQDPEEQKAFDGLLRTANGRSTVNMLAYMHQGFGDRTIAEILVQPEIGAQPAMMLMRLQ